MVLALLAGSCGRDSMPAPLTPTAPHSSHVFSDITGTVVDTAFRPVAGVTIEIADGTEAGRSAVSDASGTFAFAGGTFANGIAYRAAKDGYLTQTVTGPLAYSWPSSNASLLITLESTVPPARLEAGGYVATLIADPACTQIPADVRTRSYATSVTAYSDTRYILVMQGFLKGLDQLLVGVAGHDLRFDNDEGLHEQVAPGATLRFYGVGHATVDGPTAPSPLEFAVTGLIDYCTSSRPPRNPSQCGGPNDPPIFVQCSSNRHRLVLTRR